MQQEDGSSTARRRSYHAPGRVKGASETRASILEAATRLFVEHGYAKVTVSQIAEVAGIATPTVYASTGGKGAILTSLIEDGLQSAAAEAALALLRQTVVPREAVEAAAHGTRLDNEQHHRIVWVMVSAAQTDEHAAAALVRTNQTYREALDLVAQRLDALGALRPDLTSTRTAGILWYYLGHHSWHELVVEQSWSWDAAEEWLAQQVSAAVLA